MNIRKLIYAVIIAICIVAVVLAGIWQFGKGKNKENNYSVASKSQEILKKEFNALLDNKANFEGYDFSEVKKKDNEKQVVYTAYELEENEKDKYEVDLHIPLINIDSNVADEFNLNTQKIFADKANSIFQSASTYTIYSIDYTSFVNKDILCVIIKSNLKEGTNAQRTITQIYNYNLKTGKEETIEDAISKRGVSREYVEEKIKQEVSNSIEDANKIKVSGYETFERDINSDEYKFENLTNFYLSSNGKMYIIFAYGNTNFTSEMDIIEI